MMKTPKKYIVIQFCNLSFLKYVNKGKIKFNKINYTSNYNVNHARKNYKIIARET